MPTIRVAGNISLDRVWQLDQALRPGARIRCPRRVYRLGGGAANTGAVLRALGHDIQLVARVRRDAIGELLLDRLRRGGLDLSGVERIEGITRHGEIFVQPDGERTLISTGGSPVTVPSALFAGAAPWTYFNIARLRNPLTLTPLLGQTCLIAQLPLDPEEPRPAHLLIASRSDIGDMPGAELWRRRRALDGDQLWHLVITNGANGAEVLGVDEASLLPTTPLPDLRDSIGAGDFFAAGLIDGLARGLSVPDATAVGQSVARENLQNRPAVLAESLDIAAD